MKKNNPDERVLDSSPKAASELREKHLWGETTRHGKQGLIQSSISPLFLSENFISPWKSSERAQAFRALLQCCMGSQTVTRAVDGRRAFVLEGSGDSHCTRGWSAGRPLLTRSGFFGEAGDLRVRTINSKGEACYFISLSPVYLFVK